MITKLIDGYIEKVGNETKSMRKDEVHRCWVGKIVKWVLILYALLLVYIYMRTH